jgi:hypothetical protein
MTPDLLDDLLDRSSPATRAADAGDLRAMITAAARDARPSGRRVKVAVAGGLAMLFMASGGVAVAAGLIDWPKQYAHPDAGVSFALPSGRECEARVVVIARDGGADQADAAKAEAELSDWLHTGSLDDKLDLDTALADARRIFAEQASQGMTILIGGDGILVDASSSQRKPTEDDLYAFAMRWAIGQALQKHEAGEPQFGTTYDAEGEVKCAP